ncbi:MAG: hypothetical protein RLZZ505_1969 [Verrucomicrobiota bacterium]|jgi:hypothetical protein
MPEKTTETIHLVDISVGAKTQCHKKPTTSGLMEGHVGQEIPQSDHKPSIRGNLSIDFSAIVCLFEG